MADSLQTWLKHAPPPLPLGEGQQWNVFLSYRSVNRPWVINLYDVLRTHGHTVYLDQWPSSGAPRWWESCSAGFARARRAS